jgi:SNF2 family DNA or RNA helicase
MKTRIGDFFQKAQSSVAHSIKALWGENQPSIVTVPTSLEPCDNFEVANFEIRDCQIGQIINWGFEETKSHTFSPIISKGAIIEIDSQLGGTIVNYSPDFIYLNACYPIFPSIAYSAQPIPKPQITEIDTHLIQGWYSFGFSFESPKIYGKVYNSQKDRRKGQEKASDRHDAVPLNHLAEKIIKEKAANVFDLILPILLPPIGIDADQEPGELRKLKRFQVDGVNFLMNTPRALLGDDMGTGKSIQTIAAFRLLFQRGRISSVCIVCPKAVLTDWEKKIEVWAPELRTTKLIGNSKEREIKWDTPTHIFICTYETLMKDTYSRIKGIPSKDPDRPGFLISCPNPVCLEKLLIPSGSLFRICYCPSCQEKIHFPNEKIFNPLKFNLLVLDEIQKTKNDSAKITKAVRAIKADFVWGLSGTPLENRIEDLISVCETIKPGIFDGVDTQDYQAIINAYTPIFLRRKSETVLKELKKKHSEIVWLDLLPSQRREYDRARNTGIVWLESLGKTASAQNAMVLIMKLKLICNMSSVAVESSKLDYLEEQLESIHSRGHKSLVFSQFPNSTLQKLLHPLRRFHPKIYDGSLSDNARTEIINGFQNTDQSSLMLISLKAGNAGITLTKANYVFHYDLWWNPAMHDQAVARAHRLGQDKEVFEFTLLTVNTIEANIYELLKRKRQLFDEVVDGLSKLNASSQGITEEEIFGLLGMKKNLEGIYKSSKGSIE